MNTDIFTAESLESLPQKWEALNSIDELLRNANSIESIRSIENLLTTEISCKSTEAIKCLIAKNKEQLNLC